MVNITSLKDAQRWRSRRLSSVALAEGELAVGGVYIPPSPAQAHLVVRTETVAAVASCRGKAQGHLCIHRFFFS